MKILHDVLSESLFTKCVSELEENLDTKESWYSSSLAWDPHVRKGITGSCLCKKVSTSLHESILDEIKKYFPDCNTIFIYFYIWQTNSGISIHNDTHMKFGATIYLNNDWHPNYGGWFIWEDSRTEEWKTILPKQNVMVLNNNGEEHLVTPISLIDNAMRFTIQIFGK